MDTDISNFDSETLCSIIASNRYLKFNNDLETKCMIELADRRLNGEDFDFESKINDLKNNFTSINITIPDISSILKNIKDL